MKISFSLTIERKQKEAPTAPVQSAVPPKITARLPEPSYDFRRTYL